MKKWLWMLCLVCAGAAHAESWQAIGGTDQAELLMDVDSIKANKDIREAWSMWNFKTARPNNDKNFPALKSYRDMHQYNCKEETLKLTREIIYSESDGKGNQLDHSDVLKNMQFTKPAPNSVGSAMVELVCGYDIPAAAK